MKQVLLFDTAIATTNIGDEIIFESVKIGLSRVLDEALVFRLGTHIENYNAFQMYKNWKYKLLCQNADYKFICGTNLLAESVKGRFSQWQLNKYNYPLYSESILVGVGKRINYKTIDNYTKKLYCKVLSNKYIHSVRDDETKKIVEGLGFSAINTGCPTMWGLTTELCGTIPLCKSKNAIISVSGYKDQIDYENDREFIKIVQNNYQRVYVWIQTAVDETYLDSIPGTKDFIRIYSLKKYSDILENGDVDYIGTRLHGGIFALQHKARTLVISIDERAEGFYNTNNLPIIKREEVKTGLDRRINSSWKTDIHIKTNEIKQFLNQFV